MAMLAARNLLAFAAAAPLPTPVNADALRARRPA
jgi:hypothetical protein